MKDRWGANNGEKHRTFQQARHEGGTVSQGMSPEGFVTHLMEL